MKELRNLLLRLHSDARALQISTSRDFKQCCRRLSKTVNEIADLWHTASSRLYDAEAARIGTILHSMWCDALCGSMMKEGESYLLMEPWFEGQARVRLIGAALSGLAIPKCDDGVLNNLMLDLAGCLVKAADEARVEAKPPPQPAQPQPAGRTTSNGTVLRIIEA